MYSASKEEINMLEARGSFSQSELPWQTILLECSYVLLKNSCLCCHNLRDTSDPCALHLSLLFPPTVCPIGMWRGPEQKMIRMSSLMLAYKLALCFLTPGPSGSCRLWGLWSQILFLWTILLVSGARPALILGLFWLLFVFWLLLSPLLNLGLKLNWPFATSACCQLTGADRSLMYVYFLKNVWPYQKAFEIRWHLLYLEISTDRFMLIKMQFMSMSSARERRIKRARERELIPGFCKWKTRQRHREFQTTAYSRRHCSLGSWIPLKNHEKALYSCHCDEEEKQISEDFTKKTFCDQKA